MRVRVEGDSGRVLANDMINEGGDADEDNANDQSLHEHSQSVDEA